VSHLYVTLYCEAFGIDFTEFPQRERTRSRPKTGTVIAMLPNPHLPIRTSMTYRGSETPDLGDFTVEQEVTRAAVGLAHAARDSDYSDDLVEIGGEEFARSQPTTCAMAGGALADIGDSEREAAAELERAISQYDQDSDPGGHRWFGGRALAGTDLAVVRLRSGALDAAAAALEPVLVLPPAQRVSTLTARLAQVRAELTAPAFQGSPQARDLGDQIEEFGREAVTAGLHSLTG
jgi:hypothetical protein